jgi:fatty-acyl-CoA synthase
MSSTLSTIERLEVAADTDTGVHFVGHSVAPDGPVHVSWRQIHDEARAVGAALQARGLLPGDHVAVLGPTSRELMTIVRGCWMAGIASMVLPLPMRMGSLDEFVDSTRARIRHGDAKLVLIDDQLAPFYEAAAGDPPIESVGSVLPGAGPQLQCSSVCMPLPEHERHPPACRFQSMWPLMR